MSDDPKPRLMSDDPIDYLCENCFAMPGEPCTVVRESSPNNGQPRRGYHRERVTTAEWATGRLGEFKRNLAWQRTREGIADSERRLAEAKASRPADD